MRFDRAELGSLYAAHRIDLVRLAVLLREERRGAARDDAVRAGEAAAHAAFCAVLGRVRSLADPDEADALLRGEVVAQVRRALRSDRAQEVAPAPDDHALGDHEPGDHTPGDHEPGDHPPPTRPDPLPEAHRAALAALATLPHRQREVVVLREWAQLPDPEIAAALRASTRAVHTAAAQAATVLGDQAARLGPALRARADLITPEVLRPPPEPEPVRPPVRRRAVTWVAVAAVLAVTAGAALVIGRLVDHGALPQPPGDVRDVARGDLDGDGRADRAWIVEPGELVVGLADGSLLRAEFPRQTRDAAELLGLAEVGIDRRVVVATDHNPYIANVWVWQVDGGALRVVPKGNFYLTIDPHHVTWVDADGRLLTGVFDPAQGPQRRVWAQQAWAESGVLTSTPFDVQWCWDAPVQPHPRECREGESFGPHVGEVADLPALYPPVHDEVGPDTVLLQGSGADAVMVRLRGREFTLVRHGRERSLQLPPAEYYSLANQALDLGGTDGWLLRQGLRGRTRVLVVVDRSSRPVVLPPPGGGAAWHPSESVDVWPTAAGGLYSRRHLADNRYQVWQWRVEQGRLVPRDLGEVCFDDFAYPPRYGRC